jgi:glucose/arabinose dehydrogenase
MADPRPDGLSFAAVLWVSGLLRFCYFIDCPITALLPLLSMQVTIKRVLYSLFVVAAFVLVSKGSPRQNLNQIWELATDTQKIRIIPIAQGLDSPWSMALLPSGDILVTERPGRLRLIRNGKLEDEPIGGLPEIKFGTHGGLLDVTLHPNFENNGWIYFAYSKGGERGVTTAVSRGRLDGKRLVDVADVFVADAWTPGSLNVGGRVVFDKTGMLYTSIGDRGPTTEPLSQDLGNHNGKIVRLHDDGRIPSDNPFVNRPGAKAEIYSYGHRNPQGMTVHPETGEVWASEHGPMGGDEVNVIRRGANYGWPVVSYGRKYTGEIISQQPFRDGMEPPRFFWVPSIGISGILFYTGDRFPAWKGQLLVTGMSGRMIQCVRLAGRGQNERELMLMELRQEIRDIRQGPDGLIYLVTRQNSNRTPKSGMVLRIEPAG